MQRYAESVEDFEKARSLKPYDPALVVNYKKLQNVTCIVLCEPGDEKNFD